MIVGQPGSGKSTLARRIGARLDLPVIHMDHIHWKPGWIERTAAEKAVLARAAEAGEAWVFEGGFSTTWPSRLARAEMLVVLDLPFALRCWRVVWRTLRHWGKTRPDLPDNCPERFNREFWHFIWRTRNTNRVRILSLARMAAKGKPVHVLRRPREVRAFLASLDSAGDCGQKPGHDPA